MYTNFLIQVADESNAVVLKFGLALQQIIDVVGKSNFLLLENIMKMDVEKDKNPFSTLMTFPTVKTRAWVAKTEINKLMRD